MSGSKKVFTTLGSSNHVPEEREQFDYYATDPRAVELLLEMETFSHVIWEPACGEGHISKVLQAHGHEVISTDLIYRGFGDPEPLDFLNETLDGFEGDIITNPPYSIGLQFVQRALESVRPGGKVAMFLKVQFLEGQKRGELFTHTPPEQSTFPVPGWPVSRTGSRLKKAILPPLPMRGMCGKRDSPVIRLLNGLIERNDDHGNQGFRGTHYL